MKKNFIFLVLLAAFYLNTYAQQQWVAGYNGTSNGIDEAKAIATDKSGNIYVTGYAAMGAAGLDYVTIKYNSSGAKQWTATYNGTGNGDDAARAIFVDDAGNVYITGGSNEVHFSIFDVDATTIKYNSQGTQLWVARYGTGSTRENEANAIKVDKNGNVYITGFTTVSHTGYANADYLTIKYNSAGVQQWVATHNGPGNAGDAAIGLGLDAAGNIYVTGTDFAGHDPQGEGDYLTIKYDPAGAEQWQARFNGTISEADGATAIVVDDAGNSYVTGSSRLGGINTDYVTIKYNTNGVQQWLADYGGKAAQGDIPGAIAIDKNGNVYVTGTDQTFPYFYDYRTVKYNANGKQLWTAKYDGPSSGNDFANAIAVDNNGNVYVTGQSQDKAIFYWDIATVVYSSSGVQKAVARFNGTKDSDDVAYAIALDNSGNVYVAGSTTNKQTSTDFTTIKYRVPASASNIAALQNENNTRQPGKITQVFPNPVKDYAGIKFHLPSSNKTQVIITDASGNLVAILINTQLQAGDYSVQWNTQKSLPGVYYCKLTSGEMQDVKRIVVSR